MSSQEELEVNKVTAQGNEEHHSRSSNHSGRSHSKKRKLKKFFKKHRGLLLNLSVILLALVVVTAVAMIADLRSGMDKPDPGVSAQPTESTAAATDSTLQITVPIFPDEVLLIEPSASAFWNRDLSEPALDALKRYKSEGQRLDQGLPLTLSFDVTGLPVGYTVSAVTVEVSEAADMAVSRVFELGADRRSVDIYHLKTGTQYYYRISLTLSDRSVTAVQGSFQTADTLRLLHVEGAVNVRDIGGRKTADGKTVRQGLLLRGGELDGAVEPSYRVTQNGLNDLLTVFGIRTDMDLRSPADNVYGTDALGANVEHIYYDVFAYEHIFTPYGSSVIAKVFSDLADPGKYPVYLHCTYGLDRTGTVCYLLEALLGVQEDDLLRDYEISVLYREYLDQASLNKMIDALNALEGDTMQQKVEGYLLSIGVTAQQIASIKQIFLEG